MEKNDSNVTREMESPVEELEPKAAPDWWDWLAELTAAPEKNPRPASPEFKARRRHAAEQMLEELMGE